MTQHAYGRTTSRMADLEPVIMPRIISVMRVSAHTGKSYAALVAVEKAPRGDARPDVMARESNGELVWAIVRAGQHVTTFFRRKGQRCDAAYFRVDHIVNMTGGTA